MLSHDLIACLLESGHTLVWPGCGLQDFIAVATLGCLLYEDYGLVVMTALVRGELHLWLSTENWEEVHA